MASRESGIKHLLVVDDDPSVRRGLPQILAAPGVDVQTAQSAEEAERILAALEVDLVITDLSLRGFGDTDGLGLISWIQERHPQTAVVLLTAFGSAEIRDEAIRRGARACWEKKDAIEELVERVRALGIPAGN